MVPILVCRHFRVSGPSLTFTLVAWYNVHMKVAAVQMDSVADHTANFSQCEGYVRRACSLGAELVVFPENVLYRGNEEGFRASATPVPGDVTARMANLCRAHNVAIVWGSIVEQGQSGLHNTCVFIGSDGTLHAAYRKMHLFELYDGDQVPFRESDLFAHGDDIVTMSHGDFTFGLSICYDLRFPELYRVLSGRGVDVMLVPSDFTRRTGQVHWLPLLQARAIENLAYVVAPNQCGANRHTGAPSHGHSCIIGPWGDVLASCDGDNEGICVVELSRATLADARRRLRALQHRRVHSLK